MHWAWDKRYSVIDFVKFWEAFWFLHVLAGWLHLRGPLAWVHGHWILFRHQRDLTFVNVVTQKKGGGPNCFFLWSALRSLSLNSAIHYIYATELCSERWGRSKNYYGPHFQRGGGGSWPTLLKSMKNIVSFGYSTPSLLRCWVEKVHLKCFGTESL